MEKCETCKHWRKDWSNIEACKCEEVLKQIACDGYADVTFYPAKEFCCSLWEKKE